MDFEKSIPFDLGMGQHLKSIAANIEYVYIELSRIKNFNMKKFQFNRFYSLIEKDINSYINFYIGCLLWALYIKQFNNKEISDNPVLGQNITDEDGLYTINYLKEYLPKFEKDVKYYLNKNIKIEPKYFDLLDLYAKFLLVNKHFVNTKTSNDLILPFKIENPDYEKILNTIQGVVKTGDFSPLREYLDVILDSVV